MAEKLQRLLRSDAAPPGLSPSLLVYNRSSEKARPLAENPELGSTVAASPGDLARCTVTFCMLADDKAVEKAGRGRFMFVQGWKVRSQGAAHTCTLLLCLAK